MLSDSPPERDLQWTDSGIAASFKFINKLYDYIEKFNNYKSENTNDIEIIEDLKRAINHVSESIEKFQFNKSVAKIYEFVNILNDAITKKSLTKVNFEWSLKKLSIILQPFVPHISEEIWSSVGGDNLCIKERWVEEKIKKEIKLKIAIQINGKTKEIIEIDDGVSKEDIMDVVKNNEKIKKNIMGKKILREIYVPSKIVNLVVR